MLLVDIAQYLASRQALIYGTDVVAYGFAANGPDTCIAITEPKEGIPVLPQIDAEVHYVRVQVRALSNETAESLARRCQRCFLQQTDDPNEDTTGFIDLNPDLSIYAQLQGNPILDRQDQQNRKYFVFNVLITTKRL